MLLGLSAPLAVKHASWEDGLWCREGGCEGGGMAGEAGQQGMDQMGGKVPRTSPWGQ